jgi:hypothetical protein
LRSRLSPRAQQLYLALGTLNSHRQFGKVWRGIAIAFQPMKQDIRLLKRLGDFGEPSCPRRSWQFYRCATH